MVRASRTKIHEVSSAHEIIGAPVTDKSPAGGFYECNCSEMFCTKLSKFSYSEGGTAILWWLHNIVLEKTEESVNGELRRNYYGNAFMRGSDRKWLLTS